jgi:hypothetical protein
MRSSESIRNPNAYQAFVAIDDAIPNGNRTSVTSERIAMNYRTQGRTVLHTLASLTVVGVAVIASGCAADVNGANGSNENTNGEKEATAQSSAADFHLGFSCEETAPDLTGTFNEDGINSWTLFPSSNLCGMNVLEVDNPDEAPGTVSVDVPAHGVALGATTFAVYGGTRVSATDYSWETISATHNVQVKGCGSQPHPRVCHIVLGNSASFHAGYDKIRVAATSSFTWTTGGIGNFQTVPDNTVVHMNP